MIKHIKDKKGFVSIEAVVVMSGVLMLMLFLISLFTYNYPRIMLEKDVQTLSQKAKIQGGLTDSVSEPNHSDVETFKNELGKLGFDKNKIVITAKTINGNRNAIGVTPINAKGNNYISRDSKDLIEINVKIPVKDNLVNTPLKFFGGDNKERFYNLREVVGSERW